MLGKKASKIILHTTTHNNRTNSQKKRQSTSANTKMMQRLELPVKLPFYIKAAIIIIISMFHYIKVNTLEMREKIDILTYKNCKKNEIEILELKSIKSEILKIIE